MYTLRRIAASASMPLKPYFRTFADTPSSPKAPWKVLKLNHIALATLNLEKMTTFYNDVLHMKTSEQVPLPSHGVTTVFVEAGNTRFELLRPLGDKSPIANYLAKNANGGIHHVCLEVDDIWAAIEDLKENNIRMLSPEPVPGAHGKLVMFLHPKDCGGVLIELEQA